MNGTGNDELIFGDDFVDVGGAPRGEAYVIDTTGLTGTHNVNTSAAVLHTLRRPDGFFLGRSIVRIPAPRPGNDADWLALFSANNTVTIFKGDADSGGIVPSNYDDPSSATYYTLTTTDFNGNEQQNQSWGTAMVSAAWGGSEYLMVAPSLGGFTADDLAFYRYDSSTDMFERTGMISGTSDGWANNLAVTQDASGNASLLLLGSGATNYILKLR